VKRRIEVESVGHFFEAVLQKREMVVHTALPVGRVGRRHWVRVAGPVQIVAEHVEAAGPLVEEALYEADIRVRVLRKVEHDGGLIFRSDFISLKVQRRHERAEHVVARRGGRRPGEEQCVRLGEKRRKRLVEKHRKRVGHPLAGGRIHSRRFLLGSRPLFRAEGEPQHAGGTVFAIRHRFFAFESSGDVISLL
jgi:hypothetical protein